MAASLEALLDIANVAKSDAAIMEDPLLSFFKTLPLPLLRFELWDLLWLVVWYSRVDLCSFLGLCSIPYFLEIPCLPWTSHLVRLPRFFFISWWLLVALAVGLGMFSRSLAVLMESSTCLCCRMKESLFNFSLLLPDPLNSFHRATNSDKDDAQVERLINGDKSIAQSLGFDEVT